MSKIFYIMGKSSTGKDTIFKRLLNDESLSFKTIVPYTTRPIRDGEVEGREYYFIDDETVEKLQSEGKIIELREYNTYHGIWKYLTVDDGKIDLSNCDYLIIGTLESYVNTKHYYKGDELVPIYIEVDDGTRLTRALRREMKEEVPRYQEMCRRYLADCDDFSEEKLIDAEVGSENRFVNKDLDICLHEIREYINRVRKAD